MRLSKAGYGNVLEIEEMSVDIVLDLLAYDSFTSDYESEYIELNKEENK